MPCSEVQVHAHNQYGILPPTHHLYPKLLISVLLGVLGDRENDRK